MRLCTVHRTALLALLLCAAHATAPAQEAPGDVYPRGHFAGSAANNAYEMLQRVPGFAIVEADADVRGYASAQGNVLIDGARPSSKRDDIATLLRRIPLASVERIELIRTSAAGVDMAGFAVLANVVRVRDANSEGALEAGVAGSTDGWLAPQAGLEYTRRRGETVLDLALKYQPEMDDDSGRGRIRTHSPEGAPTGEERLDTRTTKGNGEASASWRQPLAGGALSLSGALRGERERVDTQRWPEDGEGERVDERENTAEIELGARYERRVGERNVLKLLATRRSTRLEARERSREDGAEERFQEDGRGGESIGRLELVHERNARLSLNASLEGARNTLRSTAHLAQDGATVALPGSNVDIAETRYEAAGGLTWKPLDAWQLEASVRFERSRIEQAGDSLRQREFSYPKPRLALRWDANPRNQLRWSLSREVGQLDFEDFVASASLESGQVSAGNAELEPDKTWRMVAAWEHRLGDDAAFTLAWTHDRIEDAIDRVPVVAPDGLFDAPGNIGDGRRDALSLDLSTPLDRIGLPGGRLRAALQYRDSRVADPVTGEWRRISEEKPVEGEIELTQDLPRWRANWGLRIEHIGEREAKYRFDEVERKSEGTGWTLYAERRIGRCWRVRGEVTDLYGRDFTRSRDRYDGARSQSTLDERETRRRTTPGTFSLSLRREFGD